MQHQLHCEEIVNLTSGKLIRGNSLGRLTTNHVIYTPTASSNNVSSLVRLVSVSLSLREKKTRNNSHFHVPLTGVGTVGRKKRWKRKNVIMSWPASLLTTGYYELQKATQKGLAKTEGRILLLLSCTHCERVKAVSRRPGYTCSHQLALSRIDVES